MVRFTHPTDPQTALESNVMRRITKLLFLMVVLGSAAARAEVVTYPAPTGEVLSADYEVCADAKKVDVYAARVLDPPFAGKEWDYGGPYSFANFDMAGPTTVRITSKKSLRDTVIRPQSAGVQLNLGQRQRTRRDPGRPAQVEHRARWQARAACCLFANPIETDAPKPDDANVRYFGPGIHDAGRIDLAAGQTLYLAGGAVVKGAVAAEGDNIRICGRGILDGNDYQWRKGPYGFTLGIHGSNVEVTGITIRGSSHWTIVPRNSRQVTVRNVKLCNSRVQNDDGINPCNSQDVLITDCFIRTDDDCVAMKGLDARTGNNVEGVTVENCVLWCDRARIFLLGHESRAPEMRNIRLRNLDIIHFTMTAFLLEPGEEMCLQDIVAENIRINGEGQRELIRLLPTVNQYMRTKTPGFIRDVTFRNIEVTGRPGPYRVQVAGADQQHDVRNVTFDNVLILGNRLKSNSAAVSLGRNIEGVQFFDATEGQPPPGKR